MCTKEDCFTYFISLSRSRALVGKRGDYHLRPALSLVGRGSGTMVPNVERLVYVNSSCQQPVDLSSSCGIHKQLN